MSNDPLANVLGSFVTLPVFLGGNPPTLRLRRGMIGTFFPLAEVSDKETDMKVYHTTYRVQLGLMELEAIASGEADPPTLTKPSE